MQISIVSDDPSSMMKLKIYIKSFCILSRIKGPSRHSYYNDFDAIMMMHIGVYEYIYAITMISYESIGDMGLKFKITRGFRLPRQASHCPCGR